MFSGRRNLGSIRLGNCTSGYRYDFFGRFRCGLNKFDLLRLWFLLGLFFCFRYLELGNKLWSVLGFQFVLLFFLVGFRCFWDINRECKTGLLFSDDLVVLAVLLDIDCYIVHREGGV